MNFSEVELPTNRKFGGVFTLIFAATGVYLFNDGANTAAYLLFALAVTFFLATLIKADVLLPLNKLWMRFGLLLGMIISPIVLGLMFFGLFTPVSMLMKLFGRDELRLKLTERASHWKERNTDASQAEPFKNQF